MQAWASYVYKVPELEAGKDLAVVDVGAGGALVVVVLEVLGRQPRVTVVGAVQAETDLDRNTMLNQGMLDSCNICVYL